MGSTEEAWRGRLNFSRPNGAADWYDAMIALDDQHGPLPFVLSKHGEGWMPCDLDGRTARRIFAAWALHERDMGRDAVRDMRDRAAKMVSDYVQEQRDVCALAALVRDLPLFQAE